MKLTLYLPFLFGDHHVTEVRKLLGAISGIQDLYVSSSFHAVELDYDPAQTSPEKINEVLEEAGYLGDAVIPEEIGASSVSDKMNSPFFRKTDIYATTQKVTSFRQNLSLLNRHIWPVPGFGPLLSVKRSK